MARASLLAFQSRRLAAPRPGLHVPGYAHRLRAIIRSFAPSVVHSNGIKMHLLAAAVRGREPLVWHIRDFIGARPLVSRATRLAAVRASGAIAISNAVADDVRRTVPPRLPASVVHDAIDTDVFSVPTGGPRADLDSLGGTDRGSDGNASHRSRRDVCPLEGTRGISERRPTPEVEPCPDCRRCGSTLSAAPSTRLPLRNMMSPSCGGSPNQLSDRLIR